MQAIETKVIPATNTKPTRIKAQCARGSLIVSKDALKVYDVGESQHRAAALELVIKFAIEDKKKYGTEVGRNPWLLPFKTGTLRNGNFVRVFTQE